MDLAHMLRPASLLDFPLDIMRNLHNLQFCAVAVRFRSELLHNLHQLLIVSGDDNATPIQTGLPWSSPTGPVFAGVSFLECIALA